ncbi:metal-dependent hydrolase [Salipaludibacillus daqingensis]|uniref:metal-dependent hydrolase n=1 Tax=Salipaludibacillus daqingensis TaxID=3041001 RepID=UPI002475D653|nr:metal-dependent hydrolase [Salipaludibacillus daqingensis]
MKILRLGHAMYVFTSAAGNKYLIDPFFDMNPGCPEEYTRESYLKTIDCVFLTHGHFDHTSGLDKLKEANPEVMVVASYELALILMQKGMKNIMPINLGGCVPFSDVNVTMVQARHSSSYGETEGAPIYAGESAGYVFEFDKDQTIYHSGDTNIMLDMELIQDLYEPTVAILSSGGHMTMGPREAAYAVKHLLNVGIVIPSHTFTSKEKAVRPNVLDHLLEAFPVISKMMDKDNDLKELLEDYEQTDVVVLECGEERRF